jgi:hypothetical protein
MYTYNLCQVHNSCVIISILVLTSIITVLKMKHIANFVKVSNVLYNQGFLAVLGAREQT